MSWTSGSLDVGFLPASVYTKNSLVSTLKSRRHFSETESVASPCDDMRNKEGEPSCTDQRTE